MLRFLRRESVPFMLREQELNRHWPPDGNPRRDNFRVFTGPEKPGKIGDTGGKPGGIFRFPPISGLKFPPVPEHYRRVLGDVCACGGVVFWAFASTRRRRCCRMLLALPRVCIARLNIGSCMFFFLYVYLSSNTVTMSNVSTANRKACAKGSRSFSMLSSREDMKLVPDILKQNACKCI